jgi:hypothetical protein
MTDNPSDNNPIASAVLEQFERSLAMFRQTASGCPAGEWRKGPKDYLRPAGTAYHVVESLRFYTGTTPADKFDWGGKFRTDWENPDSSKLPPQEDLLPYLDEVWSVARAWIVHQDLSLPEPSFPWTGSTLLSRMGYLLRHIQHHTAELGAELFRRGYPLPDWK